LTLRERNRARTRAEIRRQALTLFREQGYAATTVEQIAKAAEVSQSTFFRHFANKEELVLRDDYDPALIACFDAQPPEMGPLEALRVSMRDVLGSLSPELQQLEFDRHRLIMATPELRGPILQDLANNVGLFADLIAKRVGRPASDFEVRNLAGAVLGVVQTALLDNVDEGDDPMSFLARIERAVAHLDAGLPL
jgi:AcrR family transcriptional regulator